MSPVIALALPSPPNLRRTIDRRREQLRAYKKKAPGLLRLFRDCAANRVTSAQFYARLSDYWGYDQGDKLQGEGWNVKGKAADFVELSKAFVAIVNAKASERDGVVRTQLDRLSKARNPARRAFFTEMLCLRFPDRYPISNDPVARYLRGIKFRPARGASVGDAYIDLAQKLRLSLQQNPDYPAQNLAELDAAISSAYNPSEQQ